MRKLIRSKKGISPVFTTVLLIMLTVLMMTALFAYFVDYVGDFQTGRGSSVLEAVEIEDVWFRRGVSVISSQTLYVHNEISPLGSPFYQLKPASADQGHEISLSASMSVAGRQLWRRFVYPLAGIASISEGTWTFYYRAWRDVPTPILTTRSPSSTSPSSSGGWNNPTNAYADDSSYAYSSNNGRQQTYSAYDFTVPSNALISKVQVRLDAWCTGNDNILLELYDGNWLSTTFELDVATVQTTYWVDVTSWTTWNPIKINSNIRTRVTHRAVSLTDQVRLDWIPIEVTYAETPISHVDVDIFILKSDGSVRTTIATNVANSGDLPSTETTLSGTYVWNTYTVLDQTDYLEIDYYVEVTAPVFGVFAYLRIDDRSLPAVEQTRVDNIAFLVWSSGGGPVEISVYNYGKIGVKITQVYVDDRPVDFEPRVVEIAVGDHGKITAYFEWSSGSHHIKLITERGSVFEGDYVTSI